MNTETAFIIRQLEEAYNGDPWFGRSVKALLSGVDEQSAFVQANGQHSVLQLVWHTVNWREFTVNSLKPEKPVAYFEENDWQDLDHNDKSLWPEGLRKLDETQGDLIDHLRRTGDAILTNTVPGRTYDFKYLLHALIQHDVYHAGQIAYITKMLRASDG